MRIVLLLLLAGIFGLLTGGASALWAGGMLQMGPRLGDGVKVDG